MSELEKAFERTAMIDRVLVSARSTGKLRDDFNPAIDALIAAAEAKGKAEGVAEGLEKAASWLDNKWTDLDGEYYYEEAASKIRALQSKPVIIDRAGNTWQQVKPCPGSLRWTHGFSFPKLFARNFQWSMTTTPRGGERQRPKAVGPLLGGSEGCLRHNRPSGLPGPT